MARRSASLAALLCCLCLALCSATDPVGPNLLQNGGFDIYPQGTSWSGQLSVPFNSRYVYIPSWTVAGPGPVRWSVNQWNEPSPASAVALCGQDQNTLYMRPSGVRQTFASTPGATYQLDWLMSIYPSQGVYSRSFTVAVPEAGVSNTLVVSRSNPSATTWVPFTLQFTTPSASTTVGFGVPDEFYCAMIDSVSVRRVPACPGSCSGHGSCALQVSGQYACQCDPGYSGADCATLTVPCATAVAPASGAFGGGYSVVVSTVGPLVSSPDLSCFFGGVRVAGSVTAGSQVTCSAPAFDCNNEVGTHSVEVRVSNSNSDHGAACGATVNFVYQCTACGLIRAVTGPAENPWTEDQCEAVRGVEGHFFAQTGVVLRTANDGAYRFMVKLPSTSQAFYVLYRGQTNSYYKMPEPDLASDQYDPVTGFATSGPYSNWAVGAGSYSIGFNNDWNCRYTSNTNQFVCPALANLPSPRAPCAQLHTCCTLYPLADSSNGFSNDAPFSEAECEALAFVHFKFQQFTSLSLSNAVVNWRTMVKVAGNNAAFYVGFYNGKFYKLPEVPFVGNSDFNDDTGYAVSGTYAFWSLTDGVPRADGSFMLNFSASWQCTYRKDLDLFTCPSSAYTPYF